MSVHICVMVVQHAAQSSPSIRQPVEPVTAHEPVRTPQLVAGQRPRNPLYADVMARIRSFDGKVVPRGQEVQELASAGFYHVGKERRVVITA